MGRPFRVIRPMDFTKRNAAHWRLPDMHRRAFLVTIGTTSLGAGAFAQEARETVVLEGSIRNSVTREAIVSGTLVASLQSNDKLSHYSAPLNGTGSFRLYGLPPGVYHVTASCAGFEPGYVVEDGAEVPLVRLRPADSPKRVEMLAVPMGTLTGTVTGEHGLPLRNADVQAVQVGYSSPGHPRLNGKPARTITNDLGEYRLFDLAPGAYLLWVQYSEALNYDRVIDASSPTGGATPPADYTPVFYPSAHSSREAILVTVRPGELTAGISVNLRREKSYRVSGEVAAGPGGVLPIRTEIMIIPLEATAANNLPAAPRRAVADLRSTRGRFIVSGLLPGVYELYAQSIDEDLPLFDRQVLTVPASDVSGVEVRMSPGATIRILFRSREWGNELEPRNPFRLNLEPTHSSSTILGELAQLEVPVAANDDALDLAAFRNVAPGSYLIVNDPRSRENVYLAEATMDGQSILGKPIEVNGSDLTIVVTGADDGASVNGRVKLQSRVRRNPPPCMVFALPAESIDHRHPHSRTVNADPDGSFSIGRIAPGRYLFVAVEIDDTGTMFTDTNWPSILTRAKRMELSARQNSTVELELASLRR